VPCPDQKFERCEEKRSQPIAVAFSCWMIAPKKSGSPRADSPKVVFKRCEENLLRRRFRPLRFSFDFGQGDGLDSRCHIQADLSSDGQRLQSDRVLETTD
jgi:hypothetical protein